MSNQVGYSIPNYWFGKGFVKFISLAQYNRGSMAFHLKTILELFACTFWVLHIMVDKTYQIANSKLTIPHNHINNYLNSKVRTMIMKIQGKSWHIVGYKILLIPSVFHIVLTLHTHCYLKKYKYLWRSFVDTRLNTELYQILTLILSLLERINYR